MTVKSRLDISVGDTETEIMESTTTITSEERRFSIGNKGEEIIATVWGSDDNQNWEVADSKTIPPNNYEILIVGPNHYPFVKLTGRTTVPNVESIVDCYLTYTEPAQDP